MLAVCVDLPFLVHVEGKPDIAGFRQPTGLLSHAVGVAESAVDDEDTRPPRLDGVVPREYPLNGLVALGELDLPDLHAGGRDRYPGRQNNRHHGDDTISI